MTQRPASRRGRFSSTITWLFCALLCSCAGAVRMPVRAVGPAGAIPPKEIDLGFLQVGATEREEVAHQLAAVDTSYSNPRLFWARWRESRWGYWWVVGMPCNSCMAGDAHRKWHVKNLLVAFDENGKAKSKEAITDDRLLWRALHSRLLEIQAAPIDLSQPIRISLTPADPAAILLSKDHLELVRLDEGEPNVQVSVVNVVRFSHGGTANMDKSPSAATCHALELSEKTVLGKKIKFCAEASNVALLFQYFQQVGSTSMKWE